MSGTYPPGGALWLNDKKTNEKSPDFKGPLEISRDLLKVLVEQAKAGEKITMELAGWKKNTGSGKTLISLKADKPYKKAEQAPASVDDFPF